MSPRRKLPKIGIPREKEDGTTDATPFLSLGTTRWAAAPLVSVQLTTAAELWWAELWQH